MDGTVQLTHHAPTCGIFSYGGRDGGSPRGLLPSPLLGFFGGASDDGRDGRSPRGLLPPPLCDLAGGDPDVDEHSVFPGTLPECRSDIGVALIRAARKKT